MKLLDVSLDTGKLDSEIKARIIEVQNQMCDFQFFYGLNLGQRLFPVSDNLSKTLQKESMSTLSGLHLAELTVKTYHKMRSDEETDLLFKTVSKKALDYPLIINFKLKDIAISQTHIIPLLRNNTSGNTIFKTSILSY